MTRRLASISKCLHFFVMVPMLMKEKGENCGSRSFRPMSCSPGVVSPGPRVDSPGVWRRFARELRISLFLLEISENLQSSSSPVDQCVKQSSWLVDKSRWRLKSDDSSIDPSTGTKHRESDYSLLRKLPYWNIGHNLYQVYWTWIGPLLLREIWGF